MPQVDVAVAQLDAIELKEQNYLVRVACPIGIAGFFLYLFVDNVVAPAVFWQLALVRGVTACALGIVFAAAFIKPFKDKTRILSALFFLFCCAGIIACAVSVREKKNWYYEPLALMFVCYAGFLPTTYGLAALLYASITACYVGAMTCFHIQGTDARFTQIIALLGLSGAIGTCFVYANQLVRRRARNAHLNEIDATHRLNLSYEDVRKKVDELNAAYEVTKGLVKAKNDLLANISHELRTPLTLILAGIEDVQAKCDPDRVHQALFLELDKSSLRLLHLIDTILELTRLKSPHASLKESVWCITSFLDEISKSVAPLAKRKDLTLSFSPAEKPVFVLADKENIENVVLNLLTNAIKFSKDRQDGRIVVALSFKDGAASVSVEDSGVGMSPVDQQHAFDELYQGEGGKKVYRGGAGLGLFMCKRILELHGGAIQIESQLKVGSKITFTLPAASYEQETLLRAKKAKAAQSDWVEKTDIEAVRREGLPEWSQSLRAQQNYRLSSIMEVSDRRIVPRDDGPQKRHSLLIIDDNAAMVQMINNTASSDFTILRASDGEEGLKLARRFRPSVIISDMAMPKMTGLELLALIRDDANLADVPVILMTASGAEADRHKAMSTAATVFLGKPFKGEVLRAILKNILAEQQSNVEQATKVAKLAATLVIGGLAHDIHNPVSFVKTAAVGLQRYFDSVVEQASEAKIDVRESKQGFDELMASARSGLQRISESVEQLRRFAKGEEQAEPVVVPLTPIVQRAVVVTAATAKLKTDYQSRASVALRPGHMERVILNLVLNAIQAGGDGCDIRVATHDNVDHGLAIVEVTDKGPGMDAATLKKIFEPHFTTKKTGSGLGLAMSRDIVHAHGGQLFVDSEPGRGTSFKIQLPIAK